MTKIFGTDGIRDRAGHGALAPERVVRLGQVVAGLLKKNPKRFHAATPPALRALCETGSGGRGEVLIGRDTRASGPEIESALVEGFRSAGIGVVLAGVIPTPGAAFLTRKWGCALGVVISASHNPAADNGIKFFSPQGFKIPDATEREIEEILGTEFKPSRARRASVRDLSARSPEYERFLAKFSRKLKGMKIAVDCAHGAASAFAKDVFTALGAKVLVTNASPDGTNINAGCGALHPEKIAKIVRREKADAGVAFDGDADRAILVDDQGTVRDGDHVLALCAVHLQEKKALSENVVVSTVMANFGLERYLAGRGIALKRTKVGDKFVAEEMVRTGATLGGEPSGHILFFDASPSGDGLLTALRVLDVAAERGGPLSMLMADPPKYPQVLLNIPVSRTPPLDGVPAIQQAIRKADQMLRDEGRILVRYSGTEPLCRVMVEGAREAIVGRLARDIADAVKRELA